jgi:hypothetical protein
MRMPAPKGSCRGAKRDAYILLSSWAFEHSTIWYVHQAAVGMCWFGSDSPTAGCWTTPNEADAGVYFGAHPTWNAGIPEHYDCGHQVHRRTEFWLLRGAAADSNSGGAVKPVQ